MKRAEAEKLGWVFTHEDEGGTLVEEHGKVGREVLTLPSYSARKVGVTSDFTFPTEEKVLNAIAEWEASQNVPVEPEPEPEPPVPLPDASAFPKARAEAEKLTAEGKDWRKQAGKVWAAEKKKED